MKDKFILPAALAGLLQAVLLFLCMDLFLLHTETNNDHSLVSFLYRESLWFVPCVLAMLFCGGYAAPMLLFFKKRNWLCYFLCSVAFFLLFSGFFFAVTYVLPAEVPQMPPELKTHDIPCEFIGLVFGLLLIVFSFPYFVFVTLGKLIVHLIFIGIWLVPQIRQRRAASL